MDTTSDITVKSSSSSRSITQMDTTSDVTVKSTKTGDTTSGKQNLLKNLAKNIFMAKYPYWRMKKLIDMWKLYQDIKIHMISRYDIKR